MKTKDLSISIILMNISLLAFIAARPSEDTFDKIKVREFELVDSNGKQRVSFKIEDDGNIVFRMRDKTGAVRVKMDAEENGAGFLLLDENTEPVFHALAKKDNKKLTITDKDGRKKEY